MQVRVVSFRFCYLHDLFEECYSCKKEEELDHVLCPEPDSYAYEREALHNFHLPDASCHSGGESDAQSIEDFAACDLPALKFFATKRLEMHVRSAFASQSGTAGSRSVISSLLNLGVSL